MLVQNHRFVSKLPNQQILFLNLLFERESSFEVSGSSFK